MSKQFINPISKFKSKYSTYFDFAASTPVLPFIFKEMEPYLSSYYHNPSNSNSLKSIEIEEIINEYSSEILSFLGGENYKLVYTSGATESLNMCLKGLFDNGRKNKRKIITAKTEHSAVLAVCRELSRLGAEIVYLQTNKNGMISLSDLKTNIDKNTLAIVLMGINNETGVVNDIEGIAKLCEAMKVNFCCDTTQTIGKIAINLQKTPIDFLVGSAHKMYGPKGVGFLLIKDKHKLPPLIHGGGQQDNMRSGTINAAGIVGLFHSLKYTCHNLNKFKEYVNDLKEYFEKEIEKLGCFEIVAKDSERSPYISNILSLEHKVENLFSEMPEKVTYSTSSACSSSKNNGSHVLQAMGYSIEQSKNSLRFSFSHLTTKRDIKSLLELINNEIKRENNE